MKKTLFALALALVCLTGCGPVPAENTAPEDTSAAKTAYDQAENWAYLDTGAPKSADVFFLCPTVYAGAEDAYNLSLDDQETKENFVGAINMEKDIYPAACRFFAPYYRQVGLNVYELPEEEQDPYFSLAYQDVKDAFLYYLDHYNQGQPILLAGFSAADEGLLHHPGAARPAGGLLCHRLAADPGRGGPVPPAAPGHRRDGHRRSRLLQQ